MRCSFCYRDNSQVEKLVAGPRVYICDRCAYKVVHIMETTPPASGQATAGARFGAAWSITCERRRVSVAN